METTDVKNVIVDSTPEEICEGEVAIINGDIIDDGVRRALKSRHLLMIALGGVIGPGTFYATGFALRYSGPVGALIGYIIIGIDVYFVTQSLGEMATLFPSTGSFTELAGRFVDPALSFALGWNYWFMWVCIEDGREFQNILVTFSFLGDHSRQRIQRCCTDPHLLDRKAAELRVDSDLLGFLHVHIPAWSSCLRRDGILAS